MPSRLARILRAVISCRMSLRRNSFLHWRRKMYSVPLPQEFRRHTATVRFRSSPRRARRSGWRRKRLTPSPMTLSVRSHFLLTRSALLSRFPRNFSTIPYSTCRPTLQRNLHAESAQRKKKRSSSVTVRASRLVFLRQQAVRKTVRQRQVQRSLSMI